VTGIFGREGHDVYALGGRYQLDQRIGVGGMSEVWSAHDLVLDRPVAVKLLPEDKRGGVDTATIRAEARAAARIAHPNVAGVYDFGVSRFGAGETPFIVMELVEGATLDQHLRAGRLDWRIAVRVCAEVGAALCAAHSYGVVHRDIKPANIILTPTGAKVLDFGIATAVGQKDMTPDGILFGTPAYIAPERLNGAPAAPATDIYSLGVLLYHSLSGTLPWPADTDEETIHSHWHRPAAPLPEIPGVAPEVVDVCMRCLGKVPRFRPTGFVAALVLGEAVDARVYLPSLEHPLPQVQPAEAEETVQTHI
jgi:serine/threonine protein kinase